MRRHLLGVSVSASLLLCGCAGDHAGTYAFESPQQLEVTGDAETVSKAEFEVMQKLAAKETRVDGMTMIPSMRQASTTTTTLGDGVTEAAIRTVLGFSGTDGTAYEIERVTAPKLPMRVTLRATGGPDPDARAAELAAVLRESLGEQGFVSIAPASK